MSKKFVIISGIIALAALAAGLVAFFLMKNKAIAEVLEEDDDMCIDFDEDVLSV